MYAIVEMAGQQFRVAKDQKVFVHRLSGKEGDKVTFDKVLLLDDGKVTIGAPAIEGAAVTAKILSHVKGDKVIVFKKKRRKGYRKRSRHRQGFTEILIENISASGHKPAKKEKKEAAKPKKSAKTAAVKEAPKATKKPAKKTATKKADKADDLKKIEGIGPKIAGIFVEAGIDTFAKLAATDVAKLKEILVAAGPRYASKNPGSWPKQAKMAAAGKWEELKAWQDSVSGGIE